MITSEWLVVSFFKIQSMLTEEICLIDSWIDATKSQSLTFVFFFFFCSVVCVMSAVRFWCAKLSNNILINYEMAESPNSFISVVVLRCTVQCRTKGNRYCCWSLFQWNLIAFFRLSNFGCFHSIEFGWWIDLTCKQATTWIPHLKLFFITKKKKSIVKFMFFFFTLPSSS